MPRLVRPSLWDVAVVVLSVAVGTLFLWLIASLFAVVFIIKVASADENWNTCAEAYTFCERRPDHRDCSIWTQYGKPLSVCRHWNMKPNPAAVTDFCKQNQWHMGCGVRSAGANEWRDEESCPIPDKLK
jgi:hypothetical protein